jgi:uncharacterized protein (DUF488 family)
MSSNNVRPRPNILTVGHSTHTLEHFGSLLTENGVSVVADVRSSPYSRLHPQFNREVLADSLVARRIRYVFLGKELGARPRDPGCYEDGRVQYSRLARTEAFRRGLDCVIHISQAHEVALLCAEKEPLACHRSILISRELERCGATVAHVHADGTIEYQSDAVNRLLRMLEMSNLDMFKTSQEIIDEAYAKQEERIAYVDDRLRVGTRLAVE